ncbi:MAG TPA: bacteriohemerythrin [Azospirillum sp.]|nr:bacteriohemerythrin [Azospirillum sp.]
MTDSAGSFEPLTWDDRFSVGVPEIDGEHQVLLGLYNDAARGFAAGCDMEKKHKLLNDLETYAFYHFGTEEALMRICRYPRANEHGDEHASFRREVAALKAEIDRGAEFETHALNFIRSWITRHIQGSDKALGAFLADVSTHWTDQRQNTVD